MLRRARSKKRLSNPDSGSGLDEWVFEAVLTLMHSPLWDVPVMNFIDANCAVFDSEEENKLSYTQIHMEYKDLVEGLLTQHLSELGVAMPQFLHACERGAGRLSDTVMRQILGCDDFLAFRSMMLARNIELEAEALAQLRGEPVSPRTLPDARATAPPVDPAKPRKPMLRWLRRKSRSEAPERGKTLDRSKHEPAPGEYRGGDDDIEDDEDGIDEDLELARALEESRMMQERQEEIRQEREEAELNAALAASLREAEHEQAQRAAMLVTSDSDSSDAERSKNATTTPEQQAPRAAVREGKGKAPAEPSVVRMPSPEPISAIAQPPSAPSEMPGIALSPLVPAMPSVAHTSTSPRRKLAPIQLTNASAEQPPAPLIAPLEPVAASPIVPQREPDVNEVQRRAEYLRAQRDALRRKREAERNARLSDYQAGRQSPVPPQQQHQHQQPGPGDSDVLPSLPDLPSLEEKANGAAAPVPSAHRADLTRQLGKRFSPSA